MLSACVRQQANINLRRLSRRLHKYFPDGRISIGIGWQIRVVIRVPCLKQPAVFGNEVHDAHERRKFYRFMVEDPVVEIISEPPARGTIIGINDENPATWISDCGDPGD